MPDDAENFLAIDPLKLDREWLRQPELYYEYAIRLADARKELEEARNEEAITMAETAAAIRENPAKFDLDKATADAVKEAVLLQKDVKVAQRATNAARHAVDVISAACTALEHRKRALTMLVELHQSNYFADPKVGASSEARDKMAEGRKKEARQVGRLARRDDDEGKDAD